MVINLPDIEFNAIVTKLAYVIKLFAKEINPLASTPKFLTIYGDK